MYSRINVKKAHIYDHSTGKLLCGASKRGNAPNKTGVTARLIRHSHEQIAEKRGYPNPYKYCCKKCLTKINNLIDNQEEGV